VLHTAVYEAMTENSSTALQVPAAITTAGTGIPPFTDGTSNASSSLSITFRFEYAVIFIGVVGLAGNALILYALVASKQHKKHTLIVNQNALDLFSSFFLVVAYVVQISNISLSSVTGYWLCITLLSGNAYWSGVNASAVNLAIITIDRYLKIVYPNWSKRWLRRSLVIYSAVVLSWFVGIVYNTILVFCTSAVMDGVCYGYTLFDHYVDKVASFVFYIMFFYVVILAIFIFCYWRILVAIRRQARVMASHNTTGSNAAQIKSQQIQLIVLKTMIFVSAFYAIAYLPSNIHYFLLSTQIAPYLTFQDNGYYVTEFIAFFYTCSNPFIYATKFDPVKQILRKMISCKKTEQLSSGDC